jgi:hypothetical protein
MSMKEPELLITREVGGIPILGGCSSCEDVIFESGDPIGIAMEHQQKLEKLFREHFRMVHMLEDASQAAARIVREATEGK